MTQRVYMFVTGRCVSSFSVEMHLAAASQDEAQSLEQVYCVHASEFIYAYIHTYIYIYVYINTYTYIYIYIYIYTFMYVYM